MLKIDAQKPCVKAPTSEACEFVKNIVKKFHLNTVCASAACPNIAECWGKKHAAFMILGDTCTRSCAFCNVKKGHPLSPDTKEPLNVAKTVKQMGLKHVVITSVTRDDISDGGAKHFIKTIECIRTYSPTTTIEILTPDFLFKNNVIEGIVKAKPDVFNHNLETVPRLYPVVRRGARYFQSLNLLNLVKKYDPYMITKSGLMVGFGETKEEIRQVMDDLRVAKVDFLTIGQYLRPTKKHQPVVEFIKDEQFKFYKDVAYKKGFSYVSASPLTRSSYHADDDFIKLKEKRQAIAKAS
ncbi:MAG: lipoyl synthase [Alphaproteobacteria bacterium]